jgi:glycosyltransferase involved in cell wall biosynthesis
VTLIRLARAWKADVIHVQDLSFSAAGLIAAKALRLPFIVEFRDPYHIMISEVRLIFGGNPVLRFIVEVAAKVLAGLEILICNFASFVVCVAEGERMRLEHVGVQAGKIVTVMNLPSSDEVPKARPAGPSHTVGPRVVYAGTLSPWKGVDVLLNAFRLLLSSMPDAGLVVLGDGISRRSLELQANQLGIVGKVRFLGWVDPHEVFETIRSSDVSVIPHLVPSMPDKLFTYMHCATPIIASDFPGIRNILDTNMCGIVFKNGDERDLAGALRLVLGNLELRRRLASNAAVASKHYSWSNEARKLTAMYAKLQGRTKHE